MQHQGYGNHLEPLPGLGLKGKWKTWLLECRGSSYIVGSIGSRQMQSMGGWIPRHRAGRRRAERGAGGASGRGQGAAFYLSTFLCSFSSISFWSPLYQIVQLLAKHIHPGFGRSLLLLARSLTILISPAMVSKTKSCFGYHVCSQLFISPLLSLPKLQTSTGRRDENTWFTSWDLDGFSISFREEWSIF